MKVFFLLLFTVFNIIGLDAQVLQNTGFENWSTTPPEPIGWATNNFMAGMGGTPFVIQSTDAHSGSLSIQMTTATALNMQSGATDTTGGFFYTGVAPTGPGTFPVMGVPFNQHLDSLSFWYKYAPFSNDSFSVLVMITKWNFSSNMRDTISINKRLGGASANYTHFNLPIHYQSSNDIADSLLIMVSSSDRFGAKVGSVLKVDDIEISVIPTFIPYSNSINIVETFPNPTCNYLNIKGSDARNFQLVDVYGRIVKSVQFGNSGIKIIDVQNIENGLYFLKSERHACKRVEIIH